MRKLFDRDPEKKQNSKRLKQFRDLVKKKRFAEAIKCGNEYIKAVPNNPDALFLMAGIYYMNNDPKSTLRYVDRALDIATYDIDMLLLKAYTHHDMRQDKIALECCLKIQEIDPKNHAATKLCSQLDL